jgi:hypothetical protein
LQIASRLKIEIYFFPEVNAIKSPLFPWHLKRWKLRREAGAEGFTSPFRRSLEWVKTGVRPGNNLATLGASSWFIKKVNSLYYAF